MRSVSTKMKQQLISGGVVVIMNHPLIGCVLLEYLDLGHISILGPILIYAFTYDGAGGMMVSFWVVNILHYLG